MAQPLHLTASTRRIKAHEGGCVSIAWAKRRVLEAAEARATLLAAKLDRACACSIDELAKVAKTWSGDLGPGAPCRA